MAGLLLPVGGPERYTTRRVVFARPFTLGNAPEVYAAGTYEVETKEEVIERGGHTAHIRTATLLIIPTRTGTTSRTVNGSDLNAALVRDADDDSQVSSGNAIGR